MAGALSTFVGEGSANAASGTPATVKWSNIYGTDSGSSNVQALSGFTGAISITAALSGAGTLYYSLNGVYKQYTGAFAAHTGDTLSWTIQSAHSNIAGTLTVTNATAASTMATVSYALFTSWNGAGYF